MGVLEDAIREHLDLKRQHGASDEELTQQEAEALGPTRRDTPEEALEQDAPAAEADVAVEDAPAESVEPALEDPVSEPPEPPASEPPEAGLPTAGPEAPPAPADQDTVMYSPGDAPVPPDEEED